MSVERLRERRVKGNGDLHRNFYLGEKGAKLTLYLLLAEQRRNIFVMPGSGSRKIIGRKARMRESVCLSFLYITAPALDYLRRQTSSAEASVDYSNKQPSGLLGRSN